FMTGLLASNGGPTQTIALGGNSALALGQAVTGTGITVDQRDDPRSVPPDLGAFEVQATTYTVIYATDSSGSAAGQADPSDPTRARWSAPTSGKPNTAATLATSRPATITIRESRLWSAPPARRLPLPRAQPTSRSAARPWSSAVAPGSPPPARSAAATPRPASSPSRSTAPPTPSSIPRPPRSTA